MTDLLDFVALSLLPAWCRLHVAERLRAGDAPGGVLQELAARARDDPDKASTLRSRADAAIRRAGMHAITAIPACMMPERAGRRLPPAPQRPHR
jgi:hypothetical protein